MLVIAPAIGTPILEPYQEERITSFLNPSEDPRDSSYQINQSLIAVGSGGKTGRGDESTQTQAGFLPERHTDFIFAVVGERFGFAGAAFLLSLYALLIWRALRILTLSKNLYGAMIAGGIAAMLMFHLFVNVGMNVGIAPITGIPLAADELRRIVRCRHLHGDRDPSEHLCPSRSSPPGTGLPRIR